MMEDRRIQLRRQREESADLLARLRAKENVPADFDRTAAEDGLLWAMEQMDYELARLNGQDLEEELRSALNLVGRELERRDTGALKG